MKASRKGFALQALAEILIACLVSFAILAPSLRAYAKGVDAMNKAAHEAALAEASAGETLTLREDAELVEGVSEVYESAGGYVIKAKAQGGHGPVILNVALSKDGLVTGIAVDTSFESADVGGKALQEEYFANFIGSDSTEGIDVLSGATYTSNAVRECVDKALLENQVLNGLDYDGPVELSAEELLTQALTDRLGEGYAMAETEPANDKVREVYTSDAGYGIIVEGDGHNGPIRLLVHLDADGVLRKIVPLEQSESLEHGANVFNEAYLYFYEGASSFAFVDMGDGSRVIDMFGGATETSFMVLQLVQAATAQYALMNADGNA